MCVCVGGCVGVTVWVDVGVIVGVCVCVCNCIRKGPKAALSDGVILCGVGGGLTLWVGMDLHVCV